MGQIDNTFIYNSLYRIQSQMKSLTTGTKFETTPYIYNRNLSSSLLPYQLQSKISAFQRDNLNLDEYVATQARNQQLNEAKQLVSSFSKDTSINDYQSNLNTKSIASSIQNPIPAATEMNTSFQSFSAPLSTNTFSKTTLSTSSLKTMNTSFQPLAIPTTNNATVNTTDTPPVPMTLSVTSTTTPSADRYADGYSVLLGMKNQLEAMISNQKAEGQIYSEDVDRMVELNNLFKATANEKFHLENTHSLDINADRTVFYDNVRREKLLTMIKENLILMGGDTPPPAIPNYKDSAQYKALMNFRGYVLNMQVGAGNLSPITQQTFNQLVSLNDDYKLVADEKFHLENFGFDVTLIRRGYIANEAGRSSLFNIIDSSLQAMKLEAEQSIPITPPSGTIHDNEKSLAILNEMYIATIKMPLHEETLFERQQMLLNMNDKFKNVSDKEFHLSNMFFDTTSQLESESGRQTILESISETIIKLGGQLPDMLPLLSAPKATTDNYQSSKAYINLKAMYDYVLNAPLSAIYADNQKTSYAFDALYRTFKYSLTSSQKKYDIAESHSYTDLPRYHFNNKEIGRLTLLSMISDNLHAMKRDLGPPEPEPPITPPEIPNNPPSNGGGELPTNPPPIENNPLPNEDNGPGTDNGGADTSSGNLMDRLLSIKREYNNNQIKVHALEYNRLMDANQAKLNSELTKLQLLEQTNLWLLDNNTQRKYNLFALIKM